MESRVIQPQRVHKRVNLFFVLIAVFMLLTPAQSAAPDAGRHAGSNVPVYGYRIVNRYPHDPGAFTQGLAYHDGFLYESTGLHGLSSLRKVELQTGKVLKRRDLPKRYFGEGLALCGDKLIQLTYRSGIAFIYDLELRPAGSFRYDTEGWGIACDGKTLIMSDGTATLRRLDPDTYRFIGEITVQERGNPVMHLNELEYVNGEIFANIWTTNRIARISPKTGSVRGWIDLDGLSRIAQSDARLGAIDVLNGIAYDAQGGRLFVTGKNWPWLFEITLTRKH